jgi:two-component system, NtrC family, nitrogen regulation sensor histidine kinase NtrY
MFRRLKNKYLNSNLKRKIVILITLFITLIPTTLAAILSFTYYKLGIESLFNEQTSKAINGTFEIAQQYLKEHKDNIRADILAIAKGIDLNYTNLIDDPDSFVLYLDKQAEFRNLSEVLVFQPDRIISKNTFSFSFAFEKIPEVALQKADDGDVVIIATSSNDKVRALLRLNNFVHTYLLVGMYVDQSILDYLKNTKGSADKYRNLITDLRLTQIKLEIAFICTFIILCSLAIMLGSKLATVITDPLKNLVDATEKLKEGDFTIKLAEKPGRDETAVLTRAFNKMTETLSFQRSALIKANSLIDERVRFIEKVLSEISAGVIALNSAKNITLINNSATMLLDYSRKIKKRTPIYDVFPEVGGLIEKATTNPETIISDNLRIDKDNKKLHFFVRIGCLSNKRTDMIESFIITFDDITELMSAQRNAAWSDIARRIAHEIKNPLTPINLAAERLKKKFSREVSDEENFGQYIDTIIRHVREIGSMVEEFVTFARIPAPKLRKNNLNKIIEDAVFSQQVIFKKISYVFNRKIDNIFVNCDAIQISQTLSNILKNAAESIETKLQISDKEFKGEILIDVVSSDKQVTVKISDNGSGMDSELLDKAFEPYVTTKLNGTGIGLAIVKKIMEDHGGVIAISPNKQEGLIVSFSLPTYQEMNHE